MLVSATEMLQKAKAGHYAVGQFNINNLEWTKAILTVAEECKSPVILGVSEGAGKYMTGYKTVVGMVEGMLEEMNITVPVALHLDHCRTYEECVQAIQAGYSSVMIDGSSLPFEENVALTKKGVDYAHCYGITVEGELGKLVGEEGNFKVEGDPESAQTDPEQARKFVERTGIDCIAVSIGTQHGVYAVAPHLNIERLKKIHDVVDVPIVLHGGSGTPKEQVQEAIRNGIRKINIATDVLIAVANSFEDMKQKPDFKYNTGMFVNSQACAREFIKGKMREFALMD